LSGIIINKILKLLLINYLVRKVYVLFHFPSRSQYTLDRTYGRTVYINFTQKQYKSSIIPLSSEVDDTAEISLHDEEIR